MKQRIAAVLLAAALVPGGAQAATLGLTTEAPGLSSGTAVIDYLAFGPDGDLSAFGAAVDFTDGVSPAGFTEIGFGIGFSLADPTTGLTGGFDIFDEDGFFLGGELVAVGFAEDVIELRFGSLAGSGAGVFGASVLALIAFDDPLGPDPFAALVDGDALGASITISSVADGTVAPVPLPAGPGLLLSGLGMLMLRRRAGT